MHAQNTWAQRDYSIAQNNEPMKDIVFILPKKKKKKGEKTIKKKKKTTTTYK